MARVLLLAAVVIWGWTFVATKICLRYLDPLELLSLRFLIALPFLLAVVGMRRIRLDFKGHLRPLLLGSGILAVHFVIQITGLQYTTATNTGWIIAVIPLVMALLAFAILGERGCHHGPNVLWDRGRIAQIRNGGLDATREQRVRTRTMEHLLASHHFVEQEREAVDVAASVQFNVRIHLFRDHVR